MAAWIWQFPFLSPQFFAFVNLYTEWSGAEFAAIEVPVLSIQADQEKFLPPTLWGAAFHQSLSRRPASGSQNTRTRVRRPDERMLVNAVPDVVTMVLDSTHHILQLQRPHEVVPLMKEFLANRVER